MSIFDQAALDLHEKHRGKLEVRSKVPLRNREDLSAAYTPGIAAVALALAKNPERMYELSGKGNMVAVISDGSAVLGLGNIGPEGAYPVMEGKAVLFKEFGGVEAFPIVLKTQNSQEIIKLVENISVGFGGINLEDIAAPACFEIEEALKKSLDIPVFHDDQHGTAIVVLAGLINAIKVAGKDKSASILINGAGAAGLAISELLHAYGFSNIIVLDSKGALNSKRSDLNAKKSEVLRFTNLQDLEGNLRELIRGRDVFIGVSQANLVDEEMVKSMAEKSIVFAMANPDPEIPEALAFKAGAFIVATGRSDSKNQLNNVLVFPGIFRGALDNKISQFTKEMFIAAAEALANLVQNPTAEKIIPSPFDENVAKKIAESFN